MKNAVIISIAIALFAGGCGIPKKTNLPLDVSIVLPASYPRTELSDFQNMFSVDWCDFYQNENSHNYYLHKAEVYVGVDNYNECWQDSVVSVYSMRSSLFMIHGLKPRKQPVETVFLPAESILAGEKQSFSFGGKTYTFRAEAILYHFMTNSETDYWNGMKDYKLYFSI